MNPNMPKVTLRSNNWKYINLPLLHSVRFNSQRKLIHIDL